MHIQNFIKIHPFVLKMLRKNTFLHRSRAITLLLINEFSSFAIPNHSSLISMAMQNLKKIGQKLLKLESGNKVLTAGWTEGRTLNWFGGCNIIPCHFFVAGYKNICVFQVSALKKIGIVGRHYHFIKIFCIEIAFFTTFSAIFQHI